MRITIQVYSRIKSQRSKLATTILETVKKFFEQSEFANQPQKIREYMRWALRPDGPAYYEVPTPQSSKLDRSHLDYQVFAADHLDLIANLLTDLQ